MAKEWYAGEIRDSLKRAEKMSKYGLEGFPPAILSCAITGGMHSKAANPNLPETFDEQVQQVYDAYNAGAVLVHVHTRNQEKTSEASYDPETYKEINARIREKCPDIIINNTFVGCRAYWADRPADPPMLFSQGSKAEVASLDLFRNLYGPMVFTQTYDDAVANIKVLDAAGTKPELEIFDTGDLKMINQLIAGGAVKGPYWIQAIFNGAGITPAIEYLMLLEKMVPEETLLSVIGIAATQTPLAVASMLLGHHFRVGMEDNVYYKKGVLAKDNAELVERAARIATDAGRPLATCAQAREMLGLGAPRAYEFPKK